MMWLLLFRKRAVLANRQIVAYKRIEEGFNILGWVSITETFES